MAAYANVEAERYFRAALELAEGAADGRAHLLSELGQALARQSRYLDAIEVWKDAIDLHRSLGDQDAAGELYARSARAAWYAGDTPRGLVVCREGMALVGGAPDSPGLADLLHETARACHFNGLPEEMETLCRRALAMAERLGVVRVQAEALTTLGLLSNLSTEDALAAFSRAIGLAEAAGLLAQASRAHHNMGNALAGQQVSWRRRDTTLGRRRICPGRLGRRPRKSFPGTRRSRSGFSRETLRMQNRRQPHCGSCWRWLPIPGWPR